MILVATALVENLMIAVLYPLLTVVVGSTPSGAGAVLGSLSALVEAVPREQRLPAAVLLFAAVVPLNTGLKLLREWAQARTSGDVTLDVKRRVFERLRTAPYAFFLERTQGQLTYRLSVAPQNLALALLMLAMMSSYLLTSAVTVILLLSIEPRVTLAMLVVGALFAGLNRSVARRFSANAGREKLHAQSNELGIVQEFVAGAKEISVSGSGEEWAKRFGHESAVFRRFFVRDITWGAVPGLVLELAIFLLAGLAIAGLRALAPGEITGLLPVLAIYIYAVRQLLGTLGVISRQALRLAALGPDVALLRDALREHTGTVRDGERGDLGAWREIRFAGITFAYPGRDKPVLANASFAIERGKTTALVGSSGAGKTTILLLLLRLFDPTGGRILLDGDDLGDFRREEWLSRVGYVGQELFVFNGTVAENIRFGRPLSDDEVVRAARAAHADEFVRELPYGYDSVVGDRGLSLSAGQRQRIVIARALARHPEVLVLDEATSALDSLSERLVQDALAEIAGTCTIVVVAHRLSTVRRADRIIVIEDGAVAEQGTHEELLVRRGPYAAFVRGLPDVAAGS